MSPTRRDHTANPSADELKRELAAARLENVRLFNETKEALEQQTATSEVLKVISGSPTDLQPVLEAITVNSMRLCQADIGFIYVVEDGLFRVQAASGVSAEFIADSKANPVPVRPDRGTMSGRVVEERRAIHIPDVLGDSEYTALARQRLAGYRAMLGAPMLRQGEIIGIIALWRKEPRPFTEKQVGMLERFADQAVIAVANTRLFNEIQDKSRQLEAASRHKSEFLANMSHELRTPLNAIIGFSDVLEQRMFGQLNDQQSEYVRDIAGSGRHLLHLVNEILDLAKIEAGRMELEPTEFALAETIRGALAFVRERAAGHRIELRAELPEHLGTVVGDERKLRQVLLNLLSNAVKFTPDDGRVSLRATRSQTEVQISVQDTGIGIAPEDQPNVFEEFRQVGKTSDRSREGTGLGLTLAKRFIELHRGRIWIESEVGKGTTFTFAIPVGQAAAVGEGKS